MLIHRGHKGQKVMAISPTSAFFSHAESPPLPSPLPPAPTAPSQWNFPELLRYSFTQETGKFALAKYPLILAHTSDENSLKKTNLEIINITFIIF